MDAAGIVEYEQALLATFPPLEVDRVAGLVVCAALGVTGRANSACALGEPLDADTGSVVDAVEDWYATRALTPQFRASPLMSAEVLEELARRGYRAPDGQPAATLAMVARWGTVGRGADPGQVADAVAVDADRPADWGAISDRAAADDDVIARMLAGVDGSVGWASSRDPTGALRAGGRIVVSGGVACVQAVSTRPADRRRGLATAVVAALHEWARGRGADRAFLHVSATNPATALYRSFGYVDAYEYGYLAAPARGGVRVG